MAREFITTTPAHIASAVATNSGMHARRTAILPAAKMPWGIVPPKPSLVLSSVTLKKKDGKKRFIIIFFYKAFVFSLRYMFTKGEYEARLS